jgi:hypothetical protein
MSVRPLVRWLVVALVALHVLGAARVAFGADWDVPGFTTGDALRYREIAQAEGLPYRDHVVEYPPLTWAAAEVVSVPASPTTSGRLLVLLQLAADLAVAAALAHGWGRRAAIVWLALLLPFCWEGWIFARLDLLSVALAVAGLAFVRRNREGAGGVLVGLGAFAKFWPLAVVPSLLVERRARALAHCLATLLAGGVVWLAVGGLDGLRQVATFRDAASWQVESTVGSLLLLDLGREGFYEAGALRIGEAPAWAKVVLAVLLLVAVAAAWWCAELAERAGRARDGEPAVLGSLVAVGSLMVLSPLLSPQFLVWLAPFVAIRWRDRTLVALMGLAVVITAWVAHEYGEILEEGRRTLSRLVVVRNGLLVAIVVVGFVRLVALATTAAPAMLSADDVACTTRRTRR